MKRIIFGILTAGTAALLLTGKAARADEGDSARPAVQQADWRYEGGEHDGYFRRMEERREYRHRMHEYRERMRREHERRERFEHGWDWDGR